MFTSCVISSLIKVNQLLICAPQTGVIKMEPDKRKEKQITMPACLYRYPPFCSLSVAFGQSYPNVSA